MGALSEMDGEAVSLWGTSEVGTEGGLRELEPAVVRLTERLERLEERSEAPAVSTHPCCMNGWGLY